MSRRLTKTLVLAGLALAVTASSGTAASPARAPILGVVPHEGGVHALALRAATATTAAASTKGVSLKARPCKPATCWVMRTNTVYAIYWVPSSQSVAPGYESDINQYLTRRRRGERQPHERLLGRHPVLRLDGLHQLPVDVRRVVRRHGPVPGERLPRRDRQRLPDRPADPARDREGDRGRGLVERAGFAVHPDDSERRGLLLQRHGAAVLHELLLRLPRQLQPQRPARRLRQRAVRRDRLRL